MEKIVALGLTETFLQKTEVSVYNLLNAVPSSMERPAYAGAISNTANSQQWSAAPTTQEELLSREGSRGGSVANPQKLQEQQKQKERSADNTATALLHIQNMSYDQISIATQAAVNHYGQAIDNARNELNHFDQELEENTIQLSDGTKAYYNTETGQFEKQNPEKQWQKLTEEDQEEATARATANGGTAATKQGKIASDNRNGELIASDQAFMQMQNRLTKIDRDVEAGHINSNDAKLQKAEILGDAEEKTQQLKDNAYSLKIDPTAQMTALEKDTMHQYDKQSFQGGNFDNRKEGSDFSKSPSSSVPNFTLAAQQEPVIEPKPDQTAPSQENVLPDTPDFTKAFS